MRYPDSEGQRTAEARRPLARARGMGMALCLAAGLLLSCRVAVVPPPPLPAGFPAVPTVATDGRSYAETLREAERDAVRAEERRREQEAARRRACRDSAALQPTRRGTPEPELRCW